MPLSLSGARYIHSPIKHFVELAGKPQLLLQSGRLSINKYERTALQFFILEVLLQKELCELAS